jgi:hypothetical protein
MSMHPLAVIRAISALVLVALAMSAEAQSPAFLISINRSLPREISWPSENGAFYQLESATSLGTPVWKRVVTNLAGTGGLLTAVDPEASTDLRYYRAVRLPPIGPQISTQAVEPATGEVYPPGSILGSAFLGRQFTLPNAWKAGFRDGTSTLLIVSDTEPGLILHFTSLSGTPLQVSEQLGQSFSIGNFGGFERAGPAQLNGNQLAIDWRGVGFSDDGQSLDSLGLRCLATTHPSGGVVAFVGLFTEPNRALMQQRLTELNRSVVTVPRNTRTDLVQLLSGKSFIWVKASNSGNGGNSGSLQRWTEKNAFLCPGTYEITTQSESSFSGNLSGGAFYNGYSNSNSTEAGDWTIIETASGPIMVMISSNGSAAAPIQIQGNSVVFGDQQFDFRGSHQCPTP